MKAFVLFAVLLFPACCFAQRYDAEVPQDVALKDKLDRSIKAFASAISSDPKNPTNYFKRGVAELQRSFFEEQPMEDASIDPAFQHYRNAAIADFTRVCDLTIDGADGGLKRGNTPMMVKECCDGREDRSWEKVPA
jgi:hypothetical protein